MNNMKFSDMARIITIEKPKGYDKDNGRRFFSCLEINIRKNSSFVKEVVANADEIYKRLNRGGANTSIDRTDDVVYRNNLSGLIAEYACKKLLHYRYGDGVVDIVTCGNGTAKNQIDIKLVNGKTIEVRSSGIRNGLEFAIWGKKASGDYFMDIIGPYSNGYKPSETMKDYYLRPIYTFDIGQFSDYFNSTELITLYIVGGATADMMNNPSFYVEKDMKAHKDGFHAKQSTKYKAIPIIKSLDICEFLSIFEQENNLTVLKPFKTEIKTFSDGGCTSLRK